MINRIRYILKAGIHNWIFLFCKKRGKNYELKPEKRGRIQ